MVRHRYAAKDFMSCAGKEVCDPGEMNDSTAILQTTMVIALFTIFVFGGSITDVAVKCDVLEPKGKKKDKTVLFNNPTLIKWLTNNKVKMMV